MKESSFYIFLLIVAIVIFINFFTKLPNTIVPTTLANNLVKLVNAERVKNGLNILVENSRLNDVAYNFALEMNKFQFQNHISPTGAGPPKRVSNGNVTYSGVGENLAWGPLTDREAVDAWMASPGHRSNILDPRWKQTGVGILTGRILEWGDYPVKYYVQIFIF